MRRVLAAAIAVLATGAGVHVHSADLSPANTPPLPALARTSPKFVSEVRLGASAQDPTGPENGSANLTGEILSIRPCVDGACVARGFLVF